jgi:hypothetical protein
MGWGPEHGELTGAWAESNSEDRAYDLNLLRR